MEPTRVNFNLKTKAEASLRVYLQDHEHHIVWGTNDFGDLYQAFLYFMGREPEATE